MVREEAAAAAFAAALLTGTPGRAQTADWFDANPAARARVLRACEADHSLHGTAACLNARSSETRAYARRLRPGAPEAGASPLMQDAIRRACARPPAERGILAQACPRRL